MWIAFSVEMNAGGHNVQCISNSSMILVFEGLCSFILQFKEICRCKIYVHKLYGRFMINVCRYEVRVERENRLFFHVNL